MTTWRDFQIKAAELFNSFPGFAAAENHPLQGARASVNVDVYVLHQHGPLSFSVVVECKCWNSRVPQEKAFALKTIVEDTGSSMGIILTEKGVQKGCAKFLQKNTNIIAMTFAELQMRLQRSFPNISGVEELEALVNSPKTKEIYLQRYFETHSRMLLNLGYGMCYPRPILEDDTVRYMPDFVLRPKFSDFCDILELKGPQTKLLMQYRDNIRMPSRRMSEALYQLRAYHDCSLNPVARARFLERYGLLLYRPRFLLFAGRTTGHLEDELMLRDLETSVSGLSLRVLTYDDILRAAKAAFLEELG